ncbi:MAG TPA: MFS transporter, partial [Actinomycetota bacterium]|nr:MFS transporter [Actinomycetota bacterium]
AATFAIDGLTFLFALAMIRRMNPSPPHEAAPAPGFKSILEGFSFLRGRPTLTGSFIIDLNAMIFGMPKALFPAMAALMGGGPKTVGLLYAAPSAGSFLAMAASGWTGKVRRQGLAVTIAVLGWGLSIAAFGLTRSVPVAVLCLAAAGFSDAVSGIFRTAIVQEVTPDHLRGRLSGMEIAVYAGGPTLGDVEAGVVAGLTSVRFSVVSGGLACLVGAGLTALMLPQFIRYDRTRAAAESEKPVDEPLPAT